jgi:alkylation response protein AidB-like acyl-CoA dehydrogenase
VDFDLSDEQRMLVDGARRYVRENLGTETRRHAATSTDGFSRDHWAAFAEMGWLALPVPEDAGGLGGSDVDIALLTEELGRGLSSLPYVDCAVLACSLIAASPDTALRKQLLAAIASGEAIVALAHMEPDGRSDFDTPVQTRATETAQGWQLSGMKARVVHGGPATHWLVTSRTDDADQDGFAVFIVARDASGVQVSTYELVDGSRGADLQFDAAPATLLIRDHVEAATALEAALDRAIVALAAQTVGSMEAVMLTTADYLKQRTQFGQTLSKFQALQHRMSEMFLETDQARSMLMSALAGLASGDSVYRAQAASGAKALITQAAYFVTGQGIQLHGGMGITDELGVSHHYKSALVFDKRFGDRDFHLTRSAGLAVGPR